LADVEEFAVAFKALEPAALFARTKKKSSEFSFMAY